jgi:hypothetical protein
VKGKKTAENFLCESHDFGRKNEGAQNGQARKEAGVPTINASTQKINWFKQRR